MKDQLKGKYVPLHYCNHLLDKCQITQDTNSAGKYVTEFDEFLTCYNILCIESDVQVFSRFRAGLTKDLRTELLA